MADNPEKSAQAAAQLIEQPNGSGAYYDKNQKDSVLDRQLRFGKRQIALGGK